MIHHINKLTKKALKEALKCKRRPGFGNGFTYTLHIKYEGCNLFIKCEYKNCIHSIQSDWREGYGKDEYIGEAENSKEFINEVYVWLSTYENKFR